jgi:hypothetical protein
LADADVVLFSTGYRRPLPAIVFDPSYARGSIPTAQEAICDRNSLLFSMARPSLAGIEEDHSFLVIGRREHHQVYQANLSQFRFESASSRACEIKSENAHLPVKTAHEQHVRYCVRFGADVAALLDRCGGHLHRCVKEGRRLPENGRVPRAANQFVRGPAQAIFASASISNSLLRGPRGQGFRERSE